MLKIFKQSEAKGIVSFEKKFNRSLFLLTVFYSFTLASILLISSSITYSAFSGRVRDRFERFERLPPRSEVLEIIIRQSPTPEEVRADLIGSLITVNLYLLFFAILLSYALARITLQPLKRAYNEQRRFVGDASHELRTPLAILKLELEGDLRNKSSLEEVDRMTNIINDLLMLSKIEDGRDVESKAVFDVIETVKKLIRRLEPLAASHKVSLEFISPELAINIAGDKDTFSHAFSNILENAIFYNKENGKVEIKITNNNQDKSNREVCIVFKDTGVGIEQYDLERIFDRFYRVDKSRTRKTGGSGLGLSIVKMAVARLRGDIYIQSKVGEGTEVKICFPVVD
jgi:two-component system sensor histidine kinase CiaH